jgi:hypothetical protein
MISLKHGGGKRSLKALASALGIWVLSGSSAVAYDDGSGFGTLDYGRYGLYPGFQGFGLSYHLGYGYGGRALGVGADGGYPFYGGPGYPHPAPPLRRFGKILPFPYNGSGFFTYDYPSSVVGIGPLVGNRPVVAGSDRPDMGSGYPCNTDFGPFTGRFPYPDQTP